MVIVLEMVNNVPISKGLEYIKAACELPHPYRHESLIAAMVGGRI